MAIRHVDDINAYLDLLGLDADEAHALSGNLLVTVTSFFREPEAFAALREELTNYLTRADAGGELRVWVPGCATGEEVYTIAMIVSEASGRPADIAQRLKIFGTDLDDESLTIARRAALPNVGGGADPGGSRGVTPGRRPWLPDDECPARMQRLRATRRRHGSPPPGGRDLLPQHVDLLHQRDAAARDRDVRVCASARGLLFLGTAENLDPKSPAFRPVNSDARNFARTIESTPASLP